MTRWAPDIYRYLDTVGDGTGTKSAIGDYSGGEEFKFTAAPDNVNISRLIVFIEDALALSADEYGNLSSLTNGIEVKTKDAVGDTIVDLTDGVPIKSNAGWGRLCYDSLADAYGNGNNFVKARWTFSNSGSPLLLKAGESLVVEISDNLTGLVDHTFMVQGQVAK